jgi:hypothetical protein
MIRAPRRKIHTQWTAQFLAASELARRDYFVCFTMGNHTPVADLMVGDGKSGAQFWVDVKGNSSQRGWFARDKPALPDLYYILVGVAESRDKDRFFILSQEQLNDLVHKDRLDHPDQKPGWDGVNWRDAIPFENAWDTLPH